MRPRPTAKYLPLLFVFSITLCAHPSRADDENPFNCHVDVDGSKFDLTKLATEQVVNHTRETPPTHMVDSLRFNLCADLDQVASLPKEDQCGSGTRACLTIVNNKEGQGDRVISVIPISQTPTLKPSFIVNSSPKSLQVTLCGPKYPLSGSTMAEQSMDVTLLCDDEKDSLPEFVSYDGARLTVKWTTSSACPLKGEGDATPPSGGGEQPAAGRVGSGIGWFFFMLLLAFVAYFSIGAYYNYSTYGARGADLIPHRDFWQEVPYMLRDVVSHLCSDVGPRRVSRSGYIAV